MCLYLFKKKEARKKVIIEMSYLKICFFPFDRLGLSVSAVWVTSVFVADAMFEQRQQRKLVNNIDVKKT